MTRNISLGEMHTYPTVYNNFLEFFHATVTKISMNNDMGVVVDTLSTRRSSSFIYYFCECLTSKGIGTPTVRVEHVYVSELSLQWKIFMFD